MSFRLNVVVMSVLHNLLTFNCPLRSCPTASAWMLMPSGHRLYLWCFQVLAIEPELPEDIIPATNTVKQRQKFPKDADS